MSGGDMIVKQPEFAAKDLVEELVYYYDGLCEQDVLEEILNQSYERFKDYEKMGHEFARDDSGRLMSIPQRGLELMRYYFCLLYTSRCSPPVSYPARWSAPASCSRPIPSPAATATRARCIPTRWPNSGGRS